MTGAAVLLLALALAAALADWIAVDRGYRALEYLCKPLTLLLLIGTALALDPDDGTTRTWFVGALVLCLAGDVFLMFDRAPTEPAHERPRRDWFVPGLAAFLLGHVAYIGGMLLDGVVLTRVGLGLIPVSLAIATVGLTVLKAVREGPEPGLVGPVTAYMAVISAMVVCAAGTGRVAAIVGAGLFYASDSLIAWTRFVRDLPRGRLLVITTYHLGQVGLVLSLAW